MLDATAWQMGLLSAAESPPTLLVGLFAGVWVDRRRRRSVMIADLGRAGLLLIVAVRAEAGAPAPSAKEEPDDATRMRD